MKGENPKEDRLLICFADILAIFRQSKKKIFLWAFCLGAMGAFLALTKPIRYQAEGSFREKSTKSGNVSSSMLQMLSNGTLGSSESEAMSLIKSRKLLKGVVEKLHLQARLEGKMHQETLSKLMQHNWQIAWASFINHPRPALEDPFSSIKIESLRYDGEIPLWFDLDLQENGIYKVVNKYDPTQIMGEGHLGERFQLELLSFTLIPSLPNDPVQAQTFSLRIDSLADTVKYIGRNLEVESLKNDKSMLKLKCEHRNRHMASELINAIMNSYQSFLKTNHQELAIQQLDYLNLRRDHLTQNLTQLLNSHAEFLSKDLNSVGFIDSKKEMEFLAARQHEYKQRLLTNELEIKRLKNISPSHFSYYDRYSFHEGDPHVINAILGEIRNLRQQRDALEIELQKKALQGSQNFQQSFDHQLNEMKVLQEYLLELKVIADQFQSGKLPTADYQLLNDPRYLLKNWFDRLQKAQLENPENVKKIQESFHLYQANLERLFEVHKRILQERLTHQQNPSEDYQGISLQIATELYLNYSKELIQIEADIRQNLFFIHQIEDPEFEITSLSSGLNDSVSSDMIRKASELVLNLRDENNQSLREQQRIKNELLLQRTFLSMHLKQMVQLMELNKKLIDEKIFALQSVSLELVHQQLSLLEKNFQDYVASRLQNLEQERALVKVHLESIHGEMAILPKNGRLSS